MYTEQDFQRIERAREERAYYETLKAARDKIKKGIEQIDNRSGERAIWELIQNARDLSEHAIIRIVLKKDSIEFSHQGEAFNLDTLSNLIKQQSTKHEGEETVGQYGTGFMTTHAFCRKVYIAGDCRINDENGGGAYITLPEGFCLDRTSDDENFFIEEMKKELADVKGLIRRLNEGHSDPCPWTTFTYPLGHEGKAEKISAQLDITMKLMPYVLVFNDRIASCSIFNEITGESVCFFKQAREVESLPYDSNVVLVKNKLIWKTGSPKPRLKSFLWNPQRGMIELLSLLSPWDSMMSQVSRANSSFSLYLVPKTLAPISSSTLGGFIPRSKGILSFCQKTTTG